MTSNTFDIKDVGKGVAKLTVVHDGFSPGSSVLPAHLAGPACRAVEPENRPGDRHGPACNLGSPASVAPSQPGSGTNRPRARTDRGALVIRSPSIEGQRVSDSKSGCFLDRYLGARVPVPAGGRAVRSPDRPRVGGPALAGRSRAGLLGGTSLPPKRLCPRSPHYCSSRVQDQRSAVTERLGGVNAAAASRETR